jgi:EF-P beta-lysylation protein EpmB
MNTSIWQKKLRESFTSIDLLADFLHLTAEQRNLLENRKAFPLLVPQRLAEKMEKGSVDDPLFKQFVGVKLESLTFDLDKKDPVEDKAFQVEPKLLRKYEGRALLLCTSACAMHCRYCFRQNFPYEKEKLFEKEIEAIKADPSLKEIILSGGDPLSLSNRALKELFSELEKMDHVKRIRLHTRFPIGIPERIDQEFLFLFKFLQKQVYFVIHVNHPKELDIDVLSALKSIQKLGIPVLNQSVLLKGVNDSKEVQKELSLKLVDHGILPYYLHQLDEVEGARHFFVEKEVGHEIITHLKESLSGYAVPKYVQEIPGEPSKTALVESSLRSLEKMCP